MKNEVRDLDGRFTFGSISMFEIQPTSGNTSSLWPLINRSAESRLRILEPTSVGGSRSDKVQRLIYSSAGKQARLRSVLLLMMALVSAPARRVGPTHAPSRWRTPIGSLIQLLLVVGLLGLDLPLNFQGFSTGHTLPIFHNWLWNTTYKNVGVTQDCDG